jgi:ABC-type amino acid transport substrate-binding protein
VEGRLSGKFIRCIASLGGNIQKNGSGPVCDGTASDVAVVDLTLATSVLGKGEYKDLVVIEGTDYGAEVFAVGLKQGSDLKAKLDEFLAQKYEDGTLAALAKKYESVVVNEEAFK